MKTWVGLVLFVAGAAIAGCNGGEAKSDGSIDVTATLGTWMEVRDETVVNPRFVPQAPLTQSLRKLTLNEDGSFTFELVDRSGDPTDEGKVSGTWAAVGGSIVFESTENTLKADLKPMTPQRTPGPQTMVDPQTSKKLVRLRIFDETGALARFEKK